MTPLEYKKLYGMSSAKVMTVLKIYYSDSENAKRLNKEPAKNIKNEHSFLNKYYQIPEYRPVHIIDTMYILNKMVKDRTTCPSNKRNQFYHYKHIILRKLLNAGYIDKVEKQGDFLLFSLTWEGKQYQFHQTADWYEGVNLEEKATVVEGGEYVRNEDLIPFDNELFTRWRVTYTHSCSYNMKDDENNKEIENFFQIL